MFLYLHCNRPQRIWNYLSSSPRQEMIPLTFYLTTCTLLLFYYVGQYAQYSHGFMNLVLKSQLRISSFVRDSLQIPKQLERNRPQSRCVRIEFNTACKT